MPFDDNGREYKWQGSEREDLHKMLRLANYVLENKLMIEGIVTGKYQPYDFVTSYAGITFYDDDDQEVLFVKRET